MKKAFVILVCIFTAAIMADEGRTFSNFSGVCHGNIQMEPLWGSALGWDRFDLSWEHYEPEQGKWNQEKLKQYADKRILAANKKGVKFLPILDYTVPWAAGEVPDQEFTMGRIKYTIKRQADGSFLMELFNKLDDREVKFSERKINAKRMSQRYLGAEHVKDWENYVRKVVTFLRAEPYNVEYFQIWNEAHPTSSFWYGDMDTYFKRVHLPAAKIIRELGGKVVYGGWICGAPMSEFVELMDRHDAWKTVDILDLHYFPLAAMEYLYRETSRRKVEHIGIWQTEIGFSTDPNFAGNLYPRMLYWGLKRNWSYGDKYKSFYFAYGSPNDPKAYGYKRSLLLGKELNLSGRSLENMGQIFGGGELNIYDKVSSVPELKFELDERLSSMESFKVGNKIITACHMLYNNNAKIFVNWNGNLDTIHIDYDNPLLTLKYPEIKPESIAKIERVSMYGSVLNLEPYIVKGSGLTVQVPIREPDNKEFQYVDMPESFLPQVFYTVITLK